MIWKSQKTIINCKCILEIHLLSEVVRVMQMQKYTYIFLPKILLTPMTGTYGEMGTLICDDAKY